MIKYLIQLINIYLVKYRSLFMCSHWIYLPFNPNVQLQWNCLFNYHHYWTIINFSILSKVT